MTLKWWGGSSYFLVLVFSPVQLNYFCDADIVSLPHELHLIDIRFLLENVLLGFIFHDRDVHRFIWG